MSNPTPHGAEGDYIRTIDQAKLDAEAAQLMAERSYSYRDLGRALGIHHSTARDRVQRALTATVAPAALELREVKGSQYEVAARELWVIANDPRGEYRDRVAAYREWRQVTEAYVSLFGLRVPVVQRIEVSDGWMSDIDRLEQELKLNDAPTSSVRAEP